MKILNAHHISIPVQDSVKGAGFLAVLTEDIVSDQAVYIGIVGNLDTDSPSYVAKRMAAAYWIAHHGQKLPYRKALAYFPSLVESAYRT